MSRCRSVKNNHDTHRSDVGTGITNAIYAPPLISFPSTLVLLSKFVFFYHSVWRRSSWPAGGGNASLPLIGCFDHVTRPSPRPPHLERSPPALPRPHQVVTQPVSGVQSRSTEVRIGKTKTPSSSLRTNYHELALLKL